MTDEVTIIGGGLAGTEAAWQIAGRGVPVCLYEMRPEKMTPAHETDHLAELVCSNSLGSLEPTTAPGLLKEEMRRLNSLIIAAADYAKIPAGSALAVDRVNFTQFIAEKLASLPNIRIERRELKAIPTDDLTIVATGPLTSNELAEDIGRFIGEAQLSYYDAAAPIVYAESINFDKVFRASRYDKGEADYLNCPMERDEYEHFWEELTKAEQHELKEFENRRYFEACLPVEELGRRGKDTLAFGPLKPVGLIDPRTGRRPYAVVQLRQDNAAGTLFNLVGFQTNLKWPEQKRVFHLIPGLEQAEFARFGVMHRNTFINSPKVLTGTYQSCRREKLFFAGQLTGVEGYVESAGSGLVAGINAARLAKGEEAMTFPPETMLGAMAQYITHTEAKYFQPMKANFGLLPPLERRVKDKRLRHQLMCERAFEAQERFWNIAKV